MTGTLRKLLLLLFLAIHILCESVSSYCNTTIKLNCQEEYVKAKGSKELICPNITESSNVTWRYKRTLTGTWTSSPFRFCNCSECTFYLPECEIKHDKLRLRYAEGEYEGFYECSTDRTKHCFKLQMYNCQNRDEQVIFEPPKTYPTTTGAKLTLRCGANFGCDDKVMGNISWEHNKQIINDASNKRYHICQRRNITYFETELVIQKVEEEDFHHLFVCVVTEGMSSKVRRFNVTLIDTDPRKSIPYYLRIAIPCILMLLVVACVILACWCCRKYPERCFCIMTHCSYLSRLCNAGKHKCHVFILHEQDDSRIANDVKIELSSCNYDVDTMDDILLGTDSTNEFKELCRKCGSLIVIYPEFQISETFDHQITIGKQTIKPFQVSAFVNKDREEVCRADSRFQKLGLKQFKYENSKCICGEILWRLPKIKKLKSSKRYSVEKTNSLC